MARSGSLSHTPDLGGRVCCWTWIGENVAFAGSVQSLHDVLMNSAPHRANILNADADDVGIAVVKGGGNLWAAQVFRARSDAGRSDDASSGSRDGDRSAPTGTTTWTDTGSTGTTTGGTAVPTLSPAEIARQQLRREPAHRTRGPASRPSQARAAGSGARSGALLRHPRRGLRASGSRAAHAAFSGWVRGLPLRPCARLRQLRVTQPRCGPWGSPR